MPQLKALLFDLDGVIVDTAKYHYLAWKALADAEGIPFDQEVNERLKGVSRTRSLEIILEKATRHYGALEREALARSKNDDYVRRIAKLVPSEILPGVPALLEAAAAANLRTAICSASRNTVLILERLGIEKRFDTVVSGSDVGKSKPDPEVFLVASDRLGIAAECCLVLEDAAAGIEGAKRAGMKALGLGEPRNLPGADLVYPDLRGVSLAKIKKELFP